MTEKSFKTEINNAFKFRGLSLKGEGVEFLERILAEEEPGRRKGWLEKIISSLSSQPLNTGSIDNDSLRIAVEECSQKEGETEVALHVVDAFAIPKMEYDCGKRKFVNDLENGKNILLHGRVNSKADLYLSRYNIVYQRTMRHEMFAKTTLVESNRDTRYTLSKIEDLLSLAGRIEGLVTMGMLVQLKADKFYLEDPTGTLELDLRDADFHVGLFSENSVVLVEGWYQDKILHATGIGFPPNETSSKTREHFGNINFFGGPGKFCAKASRKLRLKEAANPDATLIFVSDVWLDDTTVLERLRSMFEGFSQSPPVAFVFCGSFISKNHGPKQLQLMRDGFNELSEILRDFPEILEKSAFIFVPSLRDPVLGNILPRPGLPEFVTNGIMKRIPQCYIATNPCRIQYCTHEIVVFREDLVEKICRNCVRMPNEKKDIPEHYAKTLLSQSHLCPLPVHVAPVYWEYEHSMRLYPLPDLVIICDRYEPFTVAKRLGDTIVSNPGSFARNKFCFQVYVPATKSIEDSSISE